MSLHALKEPIKFVSRSCGGSPPRTRLLQASRRTFSGSSKVLAALDAQTAENDEDSSIEILGPFPAVSEQQGKNNRTNKSTNPLNPFFLNEAVPERQTAGSKNLTTQVSCNLEAYSKASSTSTAVLAKTNVKKSSNAKHDAPTLAYYSYKDYLPTATVVYTQHEEEANDLVGALRGPLGFDMEWRVVWQRGAAERRTALVQLSDERMILLIQVSSMKKFPQKVKEIIESPEIIKLGANIYNDGTKLFRDFGIRAQNLVELGALAQHVDPSFSKVHKRAIVSLAKIVAHYAGKSLQKGRERTGNWEGQLQQNMIDYAANDAHCALTVHKRIMAIAIENGITHSPADYTRSVTDTSNAIATPVEAITAATVSPQPLRAYNMWHHHRKPLNVMCTELTSRGEPLKESTVISYVVKALTTDKQLAFDMNRLKELVHMELSSWQRHRGWIAQAEAEGRGV